MKVRWYCFTCGDIIEWGTGRVGGEEGIFESGDRTNNNRQYEWFESWFDSSPAPEWNDRWWIGECFNDHVFSLELDLSEVGT